MRIETPRLRLRPLQEPDADFVLRLVNDPAFIENIADKNLRTSEDVRTFLREGPWTNQARAGYGQLLVEAKDAREAVGVCGLLYREALGLTDVGFAILAEFRGRGFAIEAARAVLEYGYTDLELAEIVGLTSPTNLASIRVLERLGMHQDGSVRLHPTGPETLLYR